MNWLMIPRLFELDLKSGSSLARVGQTGMNAILQEALMGTAHIQHAAIIRRKDAVIRAKSTLFNIQQAEFLRIEYAFENPKEVRESDIPFSLMDCTYKAVRADKMSIYGKHDKRGLVVAKTLHHYIIGTYESNMYASVAVEAVEKLAEYFRKKDK